jgi:acetate kinase
MRVLVVNAGSSSVKLTLLDERDMVVARADLAVGPGERESERIAATIATMPAPDAVGHRVVHGGGDFVRPVRLDPPVIDRLYELVDLAPLHQSLSLAGIAEAGRALPDVPAVACFDTAFHATLPPAAATYALPAAWRERFGLRRYGFHGLSHAYAVRRAAELLAGPPGGGGLLGGGGSLGAGGAFSGGGSSGGERVVVAHLGAGASLAAVAGGRSVDTTMGFTPLAGLVMATRSGDVDPGLLVWLLERGEVSTAELSDALEHRSGLLGLAGAPDMRTLLSRVATGDSEARFAVEVYLHRLRSGIAGMAATLGGLDTLVFTGGVGENQPPIRERCAEGLAFLGVAVDGARNAEAKGDAEITGTGARVRTLIVKAREDLEIAAGVRATLNRPGP